MALIEAHTVRIGSHSHACFSGGGHCAAAARRRRACRSFAADQGQIRQGSYGKKYYLSSGDVEAVGSAASGEGKAPWVLGLQTNERSIVWNDELAERLLKNVASRDLGISEEELEERLAEIGALIPDLRSKIPSMKADLLVRCGGCPA